MGTRLRLKRLATASILAAALMAALAAPAHATEDIGFTGVPTGDGGEIVFGSTGTNFPLSDVAFARVDAGGQVVARATRSVIDSGAEDAATLVRFGVDYYAVVNAGGNIHLFGLNPDLTIDPDCQHLVIDFGGNEFARAAAKAGGSYIFVVGTRDNQALSVRILPRECRVDTSYQSNGMLLVPGLRSFYDVDIDHASQTRTLGGTDGQRAIIWRSNWDGMGLNDLGGDGTLKVDASPGQDVFYSVSYNPRLDRVYGAGQAGQEAFAGCWNSSGAGVCGTNGHTNFNVAQGQEFFFDMKVTRGDVWLAGTGVFNNDPHAIAGLLDLDLRPRSEFSDDGFNDYGFLGRSEVLDIEKVGGTPYFVGWAFNGANGFDFLKFTVNRNGSLNTGFGGPNGLLVDFAGAGPMTLGAADTTEGAGCTQHVPAERLATFRAPSDPSRGYVEALYRDVLLRGAAPNSRRDQPEIRRWAGLITVGVARRDVARAFVESDSRRRLMLSWLHQDYLGRQPEAGELSSLVAGMRRGMTLEDVKVSLLGSAEYFAGCPGGRNSSYVRAVYDDVLGSTPERSVRDALSDRLRMGTTRETIARELVTSREAYAVVINDDYQRYLRRAPRQAELNGLLPLFERGLTKELFLTGLLGSQEYFSSVGGGGDFLRSFTLRNSGVGSGSLRRAATLQAVVSREGSLRTLAGPSSRAAGAGARPAVVRVRRLRRVGTVSFGRRARGRFRIRWDRRVRRRFVSPGRYVFSLRAVDRRGRLLDIAQPVRIRISRRR